MAGDTRDPNSSSATDTKKYATFNPPPSANSLPLEASHNTAGHHGEVPKLSEAVKTVRWGDFKQVHMYPCARDSFLLGIGGAFGVGGVRVVLGGGSTIYLIPDFCFLGRIVALGIVIGEFENRTLMRLAGILAWWDAIGALELGIFNWNFMIEL
jgi:cytochrome c oxidase assembly protein subunit 20